MIHINITFERDEKNGYYSHVDAFVDDEKDEYIPHSAMGKLYSVVNDIEYQLNHPNK